MLGALVASREHRAARVLPELTWDEGIVLTKATLSFSLDRKVALNESTREIVFVLASVPLLHTAATQANPLPFLQSLLPHAGDKKKGLS